MRDCNKCIHHISGSCSAWECEMQTLEDYRSKAIDEFAERIKTNSELGYIGYLDRVVDEIAEQMKAGGKMRLIDADKFMENLIYCNGLGRRGLEAVLKTLKEQPTAYDISKVVEELEECSDKYKSSSCEYEQGKAFSYKNAIDIVKRGGAE